MEIGVALFEGSVTLPESSVARSDPRVVAERLGHATVSVTLGVYSHVLPDMQRQAAEVLEGIMGAPAAWASREE